MAVGIAVLGRAEASIFDTARAKLSDITGPVLLEVRAPLVAVEHWFSSLGSMLTVYSENIELKRENAELRRWQDVALSLETRMKRYERLLNTVADPNMPAVTARVIGESNKPFVKTMILNAGTGQGVKKGQGVLDDRGLIGRIYLTGERTSWVILLTDLNSRVPVVIEPSQRRAILAGDNSPAPALELDLGEGGIKNGDRVLSTGDGGLLPPGVPVGVVMEDGDGFRVALFAPASGSDYVRVIDYAVPPMPASVADVLLPPSQVAKPERLIPADRGVASAIRAMRTPQYDTTAPVSPDAEEER